MNVPARKFTIYDLRFTISGCALGLLLACLSPALPAQAAPGKDLKTGPSTNAPALAEIEIPQSLFTIPATAKEGRNPFFPRSTATLPQPTKPVESLADLRSLVLNGITSRPKATVMINNKTFEKGEEGEVKLPGGGKVLIRCEEIKEDSAIILISGTQRRELRLRTGV